MSLRRDITDSTPIALDQPTSVVVTVDGVVGGFALFDPPVGGPGQGPDTWFDDQLGLTRLARSIESGLDVVPAGPVPSITVAICTKDRPERLRRLLHSIDALDGLDGLRVVVVDNAPSDDRTEQVASGFDRVTHIVEPRAGLDFARNAALAAVDTEVIAYLDDDVVVDPGWLRGLRHAWAHNPGIGGVTGLVMAFKLEPAARLAFERYGGFRRGHRRLRFGRSMAGAPLHPSGAGSMGAGCNMSFDRRLLTELGGFDTALDTGRPLPGGGDLDIFYRVARSGRGLVYEPGYAVYHEHRETIDELRHQYFTWGQGLFAFLSKSRRSDPENRAQLRALRRWWIRDMIGQARDGAPRPRADALAELRGALRGIGEYDRSQARSGAIDREARA